MGQGLSDEDEYADKDLPLADVEFREIELQRQVRGRDTGDQSLERIEIWWRCNRDSFSACRYLRPFSVSVLFRKLAHLLWGVWPNHSGGASANSFLPVMAVQPFWRQHVRADVENSVSLQFIDTFLA